VSDPFADYWCAFRDESSYRLLWDIHNVCKNPIWGVVLTYDTLAYTLNISRM